MRVCQLKKELYEPKKIEAVYQNIVARSNTENPQFYEIRVDDFVVVEKTSDPERFMSYSDFVDATTKNIGIYLFYSKTNASDKFYFFLDVNSFSSLSGLKGIEQHYNTEEQEKTQKDKWRKDLHYESLIEENQALKKQIEEYETTIELMEEEKDTIKSNRDLGVESVFGLFVNGVAKSEFVKNNFPQFTELAGFGKENQNTEPKQESSNNTFKRKGTSAKDIEDVNIDEEETEDAESEDLSDEDKAHIGFMREIKSRVGAVELKNVIHLLDMVTANPQSIHFAIKQVSNYLKQKPTSANPTKDDAVNDLNSNPF